MVSKYPTFLIYPSIAIRYWKNWKSQTLAVDVIYFDFAEAIYCHLVYQMIILWILYLTN